jgi:hypothetical protein
LTKPERTVRLQRGEAIAKTFPQELDRWLNKRRANRLPLPTLRVETAAD